MKDVTVEYFRNEFESLISFYNRNVTDIGLHPCHDGTGLELENVKFKDIRTMSHIISAPDLFSQDYAQHVSSGIIY